MEINFFETFSKQNIYWWELCIEGEYYENRF